MKEIQGDSHDADAWRNLGMLYYTQEQYEEALEMLYQSLALDSSRPIQHYSLGLVLEKIGYFRQAIQAYQAAIALDSRFIEAYKSLGNLLADLGEFNQAEALYIQVLEWEQCDYTLFLGLGNVFLVQHQLDRAIEAYETALQLNPRDAIILYNLGLAFEAKNERSQAALYFGYAAYRQGKYEEAISYYQRVLAAQSGDIDFYISLANCYNQIEQFEAAIATYQDGLRLYPTATDLYLHLILTLQNCGCIEEAIKVASDALLFLPNEIVFKVEQARILPILYQDREQIDFYRARLIKLLDFIINNTNLETPESKESALKAIGWRTNFYLQYQGYNDLELQKQYGQFVHKVMATNYPSWSKKPPMPPLESDRKIRIGYVSDCFHWHTVGMVFLGWLKNHNRQQFQVSCYYTNERVDGITEEFQKYSDHFYHIPDNLEAICQQIVSDELHILIFLDIGMSAQTQQIAGLHLAPIQCTAWGHPVTSGLPTIDYFLSGDLMEPPNPESHYSEQLIRLPNLGICYSQPTLPEPTKTRSDFHLREEAVVYLSCQSLFKYLPQYDDIFAAIAQQVPTAQFVFVSHPSRPITEQFKQQLQRAFAKFGLNSEDYCIILPRLSHLDYWNLNGVSDIFLDTFGFTGFLTTLDSIACNLPVVTCPGEVMRSRQSSGILKRLGVTETIAKDVSEYIQIAVRLGLDPDWRHQIVEQIKQGHPYLYDDRTCISALETFYRRVVQRYSKVLSPE